MKAAAGRKNMGLSAELGDGGRLFFGGMPELRNI